MGSATGIAHYIYSCRKVDDANGQEFTYKVSDCSHFAPRGPSAFEAAGGHARLDVWPIAPPFPWRHGPPPASSRRRARGHRPVACEVLTNLQVCLLSHLALGRPRIAPPSGRSGGRAYTPLQAQVVRGIRDDCSIAVRPPFSMGGRGAAKLDSTFELALQVAGASVGARVAPPPGLQGSAFKADRAKFLRAGVEGFDPVPWLPVLEGACYLEPRLLEGHQEKDSDLPLARFGASRREAIEFARMLDRAGRLHLSPPGQAPDSERMNVLAVYKTPTTDRTVWDRRR